MTAEATTSAGVRTDPAELTRFIAAAYGQVGVPAAEAETVAALMVGCDMRGVHTHGVRYLREYLPLLRGGAMRPAARPKVVHETSSSAVVDGDAAIGHLAAYFATEVAIRKALDGAIALVLVRNSNHFGANGTYSMMCADAGLIGLVISNSVPVMSAPGSRHSVISNTPISYAIPTADPEPTLLLDMALSQVAGSNAVMARDRGTEMAPGLILDREGRESTNPNDFLEGGSLRPIGGHKGYALALFGEVLSGVLSGAGITNEVLLYPAFHSDPSNTGHTILAINPEAFMERTEFNDRIRHLREEITGAPRADGVDRLYLPGEKEADHEAESQQNGLELDQATWAELSTIATELDLDDMLERAAA